MARAGSYCFEDQDVDDACFMMEDKHVRRLLVLDRAHRLEIGGDWGHNHTEPISV
jgi:hypothetical protein